MRRFSLCVVLTFAISTIGIAQDQMPTASDSMGKPMPEKVSDDRQIVPLNAQETAIVAVQMRQMLASVQGVTDGLARGDTKAVVAAASQSGTRMMQELPAQIRMKFPPPFAQMGLATHQVFDRIAREAAVATGPGPTLKQLGEAIQSCVACHATYRFAPLR